MQAKEIIEKLGMAPIPEGGMCAEYYRAGRYMDTPAGRRMACTTIYYLLEAGQRSCLHRLGSDEIWVHHMGAPFHIYMVRDNRLERTVLGSDIATGERPQVLVPADGAYGLCGCVSAPGFHDDDLELLGMDAVAGVEGDGALLELLAYKG